MIKDTNTEINLQYDREGIRYLEWDELFSYIT